MGGLAGPVGFDAADRLGGGPPDGAGVAAAQVDCHGVFGDVAGDDAPGMNPAEGDLLPDDHDDAGVAGPALDGDRLSGGALLPSTLDGARIDAEDIGQMNPCPMDDTFFDLLRRNVAGLVENFWAAGYVNVIAGSFLRRYSDYVSFRQLLRPSAVFLVDLMVDKEVRDHRRITRAKRTTQEWRDMVDQIPEDRTIRQATDADYRYIGIDTTDLDVGGTVQRIKDAIPEAYAG